jgi:putative endonuclease
MNDRQFYVYILSNISRNVLYIGVTNDLNRRVSEHKNNVVQGFTQKYKVHDLVFYEVFNNIENAIARENS